jgi:hypothetical protein
LGNRREEGMDLDDGQDRQPQRQTKKDEAGQDDVGPVCVEEITEKQGRQQGEKDHDQDDRLF